MTDTGRYQCWLLHVFYWYTLAQRTVNLTVTSHKSKKVLTLLLCKNTKVKTVPLTEFAKSVMKQWKKTGYWLPFVFTPGFGQADTCKVALQQKAFYLIIKAVINVSGASIHSWMVIEILISIINNERRVNFTAHKLLECLWHMALAPWQFWPLSQYLTAVIALCNPEWPRAVVYTLSCLDFTPSI